MGVTTFFLLVKPSYALCRTGHTRLMMAIRNLGLRTKKGKAARKLEVEYQVGVYCKDSHPI